MAILENWKIRSRSRKCSHSEKPFEDGDYFYTCIFEDPESDGFIRKDYSEESWKELKDGLEPFSYWRSKFEVPEPEPEDPRAMQQDDAEVLLQKLMEEDNPATEKARYILAVMLERKKQLKQVDEKTTEDRKLLMYEHLETGEVLIVPDPGIRLDEVDQVQQEVVELLDKFREQQAAEEPLEDESEETSPGEDEPESAGEEAENSAEPEPGPEGESEEEKEASPAA